MFEKSLTSIEKIKIDSSLPLEKRIVSLKSQGMELDNKYYFQSEDNKRKIICVFGNACREVNVVEEVLLNIAENSLQ